jgi:hypothetical protein
LSDQQFGGSRCHQHFDVARSFRDVKSPQFGTNTARLLTSGLLDPIDQPRRFIPWGQKTRAGAKPRRMLDLRSPAMVDFERSWPAADFAQTLRAERRLPETGESEQVTAAAG